jgi:hypothetical protein
MAQFDVHRNIGKHKEAIPFVVVVQRGREGISEFPVTHQL